MYCILFIFFPKRKIGSFLGYENEDHHWTCMYYGIVCSLHGDVQLLLFLLSFSLHELCVSLPWPAALYISVRYMWKHLCQWSNVLRLTVCWKSLLHGFNYFASRTLKKNKCMKKYSFEFSYKGYRAICIDKNFRCLWASSF